MKSLSSFTKFKWLAFKLYTMLVFWLIVGLSYPYFWWILRFESNWRKGFRAIQKCSSLFLWLLGVKVEVQGDQLPDKPLVFVANHASYIDTMVMYATIPNYFVFLGMAELLQWPLFRIFFSSGMNIAVPRNNVRASGIAFQKANEVVKKGTSVAIFAEGGIKPAVPKISGFKNGAFKIAINQGVPLVPIVIKHSNEILESFKLYGTSGRSGIIKVKVLQPLSTHELNSNDYVPLCAKVRALMIKEHEQL